VRPCRIFHIAVGETPNSLANLVILPASQGSALTRSTCSGVSLLKFFFHTLICIVVILLGRGNRAHPHRGFRREAAPKITVEPEIAQIPASLPSGEPNPRLPPNREPSDTVTTIRATTVPTGVLSGMLGFAGSKAILRVGASGGQRLCLIAAMDSPQQIHPGQRLRGRRQSQDQQSIGNASGDLDHLDRAYPHVKASW
jgi:hypothetical protein